LVDVAIRPAIVRSDRPDHCEAAVSIPPSTLKKWSRYEGLAFTQRGSGQRVRWYWIVDDIVAFVRATGKSL